MKKLNEKNKEEMPMKDEKMEMKRNTKGKVKKVKISDIKIIDELYPRENLDQEVIDNYSENIEVLPPIVINQDNVLLDGRHRTEAHKKKELTEIECIVEHLEGNDNIYQRAVELNATHGKQLSFREKKEVAIRLFDGKNGNHLVTILSVTTDCFNKWVRDIRRERDEAVEKDILQEYLKAELTQQEVADKIEVSIRKVNETKQKFSEKINLLIHKKEDAEEELREKYKDIFNFKPYSSNVWEIYQQNSFSEKDIKTDYDMLNRSLLYYYTEPFDVVYVTKDNGTTDACKSLFRRYFIGEEVEVIPHLVLLDGGDYKLESRVEQLKKKMKKGYIAIKATSFDMDISVNNLMQKHGLNLENRIIMPYANKVEDEKMQHGYDSLLVFSVK